VVLPIELLPQRRAPTPRIPIDGCFLRWQIEAIGDAGICPLDILDLDTTCGGLMVALLQPFSRGEIVLRSRDPHDQPRVEFRMLSDERDRKRLGEAVRRALQMLESGKLADLGRSDPRLHEFGDDELDAWIKVSCDAFSHAAGSCRMGGRDDQQSVVDPDCGVIGVEALRLPMPRSCRAFLVRRRT
jgi:hypothetical protein